MYIIIQDSSDADPKRKGYYTFAGSLDRAKEFAKELLFQRSRAVYISKVVAIGHTEERVTEVHIEDVARL